MCTLCVEIAKGNMSIKEIARAYMEMPLTDMEHQFGILEQVEELGKTKEFSEEIVRIVESRLGK